MAFGLQQLLLEIVILPGCQEVAEPSWHNRGEALLSERNHSPSGHKVLLRQLGHLGSVSSWGRWGNGSGGRPSIIFYHQDQAGIHRSDWGVKASRVGGAPLTAASEDHSPKALMESLLATDLNLGAWVQWV